MTVGELKRLLSFADDNWDATMVITRVSTEEGAIPWFAEVKNLQFDKGYGEVRLTN